MPGTNELVRVEVSVTVNLRKHEQQQQVKHRFLIWTIGILLIVGIASAFWYFSAPPVPIMEPVRKFPYGQGRDLNEFIQGINNGSISRDSVDVEALLAGFDARNPFLNKSVPQP